MPFDWFGSSSMNLPDYERVIYSINPLIEVVCQLRFPIILKIANQDPADFQDAIRENYPILGVVNQVPLLPTVDQATQQSNAPGTYETHYQFKSEDLKWQISLNRAFVGLTTKEYRRYEEFRERFKAILEVFEIIYQPSFYSRVGLRYQDLIIRSNLDLDDDWSDLIPAYIAPEFHRPEISSLVTAFTKTTLMNIDNGQVNFRHGLVEARDVDKNSNESAYLMDADFFVEEKIGKGEYVWQFLDSYNHSARKLFRWSITEKLHLAMGPQPIYHYTT